MPVLRSREIIPTPYENKDAVVVIEPVTPAKDLDGLSHQSTTRALSMSPKAPAGEAVGSGISLRRSHRLMSKSGSGMAKVVAGMEESVRGSYRKRKREIAEADFGVDLGTLATGDAGVVREGDVSIGQNCDNVNLETGFTGREPKQYMKGIRKRKAGVESELPGTMPVGKDEDQKENKILYLRSGKKIIKNEVNPNNVDASHIGESYESRGIAGGSHENTGLMNDVNASAGVAENVGENRGNVKGKGKIVEKASLSSSIGMGKLNSDVKEADVKVTVMSHPETGNSKRKERGKEKVVEIGTNSSSRNAVSFKCENDGGKGNASSTSGDPSPSAATSSHNPEQMYTSVNPRERFRDIARRNASRFAHFSAENDVDNHSTDVPHRESPPSDAIGEAEDWPGPFSTAMKIIKDRQNLSLQQQGISRNKKGVAPVIWTPRNDTGRIFHKKPVPSLQDLCVAILVKHVDAITSLNCVPDVVRHKLSHLLSDSRRMDSHFFGLLLEGSPTEIRVKDCSWLSEEIFKKTFEGCDLSNLMVLQLDLCGRCLADYIIVDTVACSANSLPALTTISFRAAYRLSDVGLSALVSSAPSLRSVDLSQCSLITSDGICCMASSLGSVLRELYLDECQGIDVMLILPALIHLRNLEVLSLCGLESVSDNFICEFIRVRGPSIKELVLADCTRLTDTSVRVVAESCPELRVIDLSNLCKLTDAALGYLANGCRTIQNLKMRRNSFSDEAVAAYLETCGNSLRELTLSNVAQVAECTATSLSRHSRGLNYLDLSWCRNLTDEALGLIVDNCSSLKVLKVFGCSQITNAFLSGHSNQEVEIIGVKMEPILNHFQELDISHRALRYSAV